MGWKDRRFYAARVPGDPGPVFKIFDRERGAWSNETWFMEKGFSECAAQADKLNKLWEDKVKRERDEERRRKESVAG